MRFFIAAFYCCFFLLSFLHSEEEWEVPHPISAVYRDATSPQLVVDLSGNAIAVWSRFNGENLAVQASHFDGKSLKWIPIEQVFDISDPKKNVFGPSIAIDLVGNACVVWSGFDGKHLIIQATHYDLEKRAWTPYRKVKGLSCPGQNAVSQQVAMDLLGNAFAVWRRYDGKQFVIEVSHFDVQEGKWLDRRRVVRLSKKGVECSFPKLAVDLSGNAMVAWLQVEGEQVSVQAARFDCLNKRWGSPEQLVLLSERDQRAVFRKIALDAKGNAIAVWEKYDGKTMMIQASHFDLEKMKWSTPDEVRTLSRGKGDALSPNVIIDSFGNAIAVWEKFEGNFRIIQAARYGSDSLSWSSPVKLSRPFEAGEHFLDPQIAVDLQGNAVAVWRCFDELSSLIQVSHYDVKKAVWTDPKDVITLSEEGKNGYCPQVGLDGKGNALVIWRSSNEENFVIEGSRYDAGSQEWTPPKETPSLSDPVEDASNPSVILDEDGEVIGVIDKDTEEEIPSPILLPSPPLHLRGKQKVNRHLSWSERYNLLTWTCSVSHDVAFYRVYRNGKKIAKLKAIGAAYEYEDHHRIKGKSDVYDIVAVNFQGNESFPSSITIGGKK